MWIIHPFIADHLKQINLGELMETLVELQQNFFKRVSFKTHFYNGDYWVGLLESPEYKKITLKAFRELVLMPTTYMSEKDFSCLVKLKTKERNTLKYVCLLMRGTLEELIQPQFEKLITEIQEHPNH